MSGSSIRRLLPLLFSLFILSFSSCHKAGPTALAFTHVCVIDGTGSAPKCDSTVVVVGSRIQAVGAAAEVAIPQDARIIDGSGKFLIPGLADMHVHLTGASEPEGSREFILPLLVANGITTVRDMGGKVEYLKELRAEISSGKRIGPQIYFTGPYLDGDPPWFQPSIVVRNEADAANVVTQLKSEDVDFIKVQSRLNREAYFAIARNCLAQHIRFVGHVPDTVSASEASAAGQASIEHLTGVLLATSTREDELRAEQLAPGPANESVEGSLQRMRAWQRSLLYSLSPQKASALLQEFAKNRTWQVPTFPTLVHLGFLTLETDLKDDPRMNYIPLKLRQIWEQGRRGQLDHRSAEDFALRAEIFHRSLEIVGQMNAAGVPILAGTDTAAPNVIPGFSLHEDLVYLVKAGLTPMEALQAATSKPAEFLGRAAEQGTIQAGKGAALVLLDANPLEEIRNTQKINAVVMDGEFLSRKDLDRMLAKVQQFASTRGKEM